MDDADEPNDSEAEEPENRSRGFRLEAGLRSLSGLLGSLIEVDVNESPPPPRDPVDWATVDESDSDEQPGDDGQRRSEDSSRRIRTRWVRKTGSDRCLFDTRFDDDEFVVTADVPGASKDDLSIGIDPKTNDLVIGKNGTVLERVSLPWQSPEPTRVWFNNGVLEVRMRPADP